MSNNISKGKEALPENEETSKDLVSMKEAMESAKQLIKQGSATHGTRAYKERRGISIGRTYNDCESSKNKGGEESGSSTASKIVTVAAGAAVGVCLVGGLIGLLSGFGSDPEPVPEHEKKGKTMVAPGRAPHRMPRDDFQKNPKGYFRDLHADEKMKKLNGRK
ncbi:hypothetical protein L6164_001897 [Bauhinia variegata]|uniref:Uncharacterized protein n=1 Tax=Bauhinia variegata TaxID=167791 RepID=A0ACB9QAT7_BAUVA|nr:hypothetical protein L6164_001897 [Bauhinia variegata]